MTDNVQAFLGRYAGKRSPMFWLVIKTSLLTLLTVGIYRFWGKTRIRKYIWSSTSADGAAFEYTGTGTEKFLGFLMAVVVLAVYLGIVQMILFYFGLTIFSEPTTQAEMIAQIGAIYITLFAVMPLIFFAQYRARRYKLARTRWRGVRFGMEKGAGGYVWRAIVYYLLTAVTLGVLTPLATFNLEKYKADRSWYGDARIEQHGKWTALYRAMIHPILGVGIFLIGMAVLGATKLADLSIVLLIVGYIWAMVGVVSYRVQSFKYLTKNKLLAGKITFDTGIDTGTIVTTLILGSLVMGIILAALIFGAGVLVALSAEALIMMLGPVSLQIVLGLLYLMALLFSGALTMAWVTQPIIEHVVGSIAVYDHDDTLAAIHQREADQGADAEGFADALDVGGAF